MLAGFVQVCPHARVYSRIGGPQGARIGWSHLPDWLRVPDRDPAKTTSLELINGSRILPKPATGKAGRSYNAQLLIFDEWGHQEAQREIMTAASPVARSAGNKIIGISTAAGAGNHFHEQWLLAQEGQGMFPVFVPWDAHPGRDEEWLQRATAGYDLWQRHQEFPSRAEEAFVLSGRSRFDMDALQAILAGCQEPIATELDGGLRIWEPPVQTGRYVCGADTAEGLARGDFSAAVILDFHTGLEVAELHPFTSLNGARHRAHQRVESTAASAGRRSPSLPCPRRLRLVGVASWAMGIRHTTGGTRHVPRCAHRPSCPRSFPCYRRPDAAHCARLPRVLGGPTPTALGRRGPTPQAAPRRAAGHHSV